MPRQIFVSFLLFLFVVVFTAGTKGVGENCTTDADCEAGICFDVSKIVDVCKGKVCTMPCTKNADCPKVATEPQCNSFGGKKICQYGDWDKKYCQ